MGLGQRDLHTGLPAIIMGMQSFTRLLGQYVCVCQNAGYITFWAYAVTMFGQHYDIKIKTNVSDPFWSTSF